MVGVRKEFKTDENVVVGKRPATQGAHGVQRTGGAETSERRPTPKTQTILRLRLPHRLPLPSIVSTLRAGPVRVFERVHLYRRRVGLLRRVAVGRAVADLVRVGGGGVAWVWIFGRGGVSWCGIWCGTGGSWVDLGCIWVVFCVYGCSGVLVVLCLCVLVWYLCGTCVVLGWYLGGTWVVLVYTCELAQTNHIPLTFAL